MNELEQVLQQRIERLEAGEPLEVCLEDLPEKEARALRLIANIRAMSASEFDEQGSAEQRAAVLSAAAAKMATPAPVPAAPSGVSLLSQLQSWVDWLLTRRELAVGLALVLVAALIGATWIGLTRDRNGNAGGIVSITAEPGGETPEDSGPSASTELAEAPDGEAPAAAGTETTGAAHTTLVPVVANPLVLNPQTAAVEGVKGFVEIQAEDGSWSAVSSAGTVSAGQRLRTSDLSQATLTFFDGSQAHLAANTEISIDELNAQTAEEGLRTVVMTQHVGESEHSVQFRNDSGSRYEVKTPAGSGVARGTKFRVLVTPTLLARFVVTEGKVDVTNLSKTVSVIAGQLTTAVAGRAPDPPAFRVSGEGEVSQIGAVWTIGGQTFQPHAQTIIIGSPQVGDLVFVEGHLSAGGERLADRIILLRRALTNQFRLTGVVDSIGESVWKIAGQNILVGENSEIDEDAAVGDMVRVEGIILPGGSLLAQEIERLDDDDDDERRGMRFRFNGIVQAAGDDSWTISGIAVAVDEDTEIDDEIGVGDRVTVDGWKTEEGTWLARHIELVEDDDELPEFKFVGLVESTAPWRAAGISFETREWTAIDPGIAAGDLVRVSGVILEDGTWVAAEIERLDGDERDTIVLIGVVDSIDPWMVNGLQLLVTDDTAVLGEIGVGDLVVVEIRLDPDGMWQVLRIRPVHPEFGVGCFIINTVVVGLQPDQIILEHWPTITLDDDIEIEGDLEVDSVITLPICIGFDGTIIIYGNIIVIYQPIIIILPPEVPRNNRNDNHNG